MMGRTPQSIGPIPPAATREAACHRCRPTDEHTTPAGRPAPTPALRASADTPAAATPGECAENPLKGLMRG
eukprot:scaffold144359_cov33-Prasinocladus_malaysianus.AAC.2